MDTIGLYSHFIDNNHRIKVMSYLDDNLIPAKNHYSPNDLIDLVNCKTYFLKNIRVMLYSDRIKLQGSIPKYYTGKNIDQLLNSEIVDAFDSIKFNIPVVNWEESIVSRLDIGPSIHLTVNPQLIISKFIGKSYSKKTVFINNGETITLGNKSNEFIIYDKGKQSNECDENIIRLEYRMFTSKVVGRKFNKKSLKLNYLLDNLIMLPKIWYEQYSSLIKNYDPNFDVIDSKREMLHCLIYKYGYENCFMLIDNSYKSGKITTTQKTNLKKFVKNMASRKGQTQTVNPIVELDKQVDLYMNQFGLH